MRGTQPPGKVRKGTQPPERGRRDTQPLGRRRGGKSPELGRRNTQHQINKVSMENRKKGLERLMELLKLDTQQMVSHSPV